jgi:hypothetical protein
MKVLRRPPGRTLDLEDHTMAPQKPHHYANPIPHCDANQNPHLGPMIQGDVSRPRTGGIRFDRSLETLDEAVIELRKVCRVFAQHGGGALHIHTTGLPDGGELHSVALLGPRYVGQLWGIGLACADGFKARAARDFQWQSYAIDQLHGADVDQAANVTLADGRRVYDVRLVARPFPTDLTAAERLAVRAIVGCTTASPYANYERLPDLSQMALKVLEDRVRTYQQTNSLLPIRSREVIALRSPKPECASLAIEGLQGHSSSSHYTI